MDAVLCLLFADTVAVVAPFTFSIVEKQVFVFFCPSAYLGFFRLETVIGVGDNGKDLMEARREIYKNDAFASCETLLLDNMVKRVRYNGADKEKRNNWH